MFLFELIAVWLLANERQASRGQGSDCHHME